MDKLLIAYYIGILIVLVSHIQMIRTSSMKNQHAIMNLIAVALIAYYFMNTAKSFNPLK